jgi:uncharacterized membrane protein
MLRRLLVILLFALIASPFLFKTVAGVLGSWVASNAGTPTPAGLLLHGLVFLVLSGAVMRAVSYRSYRGYRGYAEPAEAYEDYEEAEKYAEDAYAEPAEAYEDYEEAEKYAEMVEGIRN